MPFLKKIRKYLIIKKLEVDLAIKFINHQQNSLHQVKKHGQSIKEMEWRRNIRNEMRTIVSRRSNKGNGSFEYFKKRKTI